MNFKSEMHSYFNLRNVTERKRKIKEILSKLEAKQQINDPVICLNITEVIIEYCLLIENNAERLLQYDRALEVLQTAQLSLKEKNQVGMLLRSYHLECFIKYYSMKYKDEEASISDIFNLGRKITQIIAKKSTNSSLNDEFTSYYALGHAWHAYGLILQFINEFKELHRTQKYEILEEARKLANKAVMLSFKTNSRDARILSSYVYAFVEELPQIILHGDEATKEKDYVEFIRPYKKLFEVARANGSIEFEYLALLNQVRLNLGRVIDAAGVSEIKKELFKKILDDCEDLEEYENLVRLPHLHFYRCLIQADIYTSIIYFEAVQEKDFNKYINKAINFAEKMQNIYISSKMTSAREKIEMYHGLSEIYMIKASYTTSRAEKLKYLKKCEELLLEDERITVAWSTKEYTTWRDLSEIYLDLSKLEHNLTYLKKCVAYAKKAYNSAFETKHFTYALVEAYKIAMITEDYQKYSLSIKHYKLAHQLIDKIQQIGKDYPYYKELKTYLQARLLVVNAKEAHHKGRYIQAMKLYRKASSLLQQNYKYSYESLLFKAYSLFEEASIHFIQEKYRKTLKTLSRITLLFDETTKRYAEDYERKFQSLIDRRSFDLQQLYFESSKTFCIAQSKILESLIYRNTGDNELSVKLLKEVNTLLKPLIDRHVHIAGYYSFTNGLYGLEKSELAIKNGDYKSAASYLASASDQFDNASHVLASDERLSQLCAGLRFFCHGWMYTLEIRRRDIDLIPSELNTNFTLAHQSFANATKSLKMFKKTSNGVSGFEKVLHYIHYSLLFQKTDIPKEKSNYMDMMAAMLSEALQYFKAAEDMERYGFVRDLLATLPQFEVADEKIFKPIAIPFTPYTPVFETTTKIEPSSVNYFISLDKDQAEVNEEIRCSIQITSDTSIYVKQIDGVFPKRDIKVVSEKQLAKNGTVEVNSLLSPGSSIIIEFTILASKPFYNRTHPQLIYLNSKNEKCHAFASPLTLQVYPKNTLSTGVVSEINEKVDLVGSVMEELGIRLGDYPILYHDINSYREALAEYFFRYETKETAKRHLSKKIDISNIPIQQMAFVDPLGEVNILYDLETYLYPKSIANLLSIIIHEKFGHGYFQQYTTLGKKLLELEYHHKGIELLMKELEKISNKYSTGIQWLVISTLVVDEGFATWLELKTFEKLLEKISDKDSQFIQQIHHEIESFKKMVFESKELNVKHDYFALKYEKTVVNPYIAGYDLFSQIEEKCGEKCVPKALEIAANVPLTRRQISLMPNTIKNDKNCADKRLEKIASSDLKIARNNVDMFEKAAKELFL